MYRITVSTLLLAITLLSCEAPPAPEVTHVITEQEYKNLLRDNKTLIESLYAGINSAMLMADTTPVTDTFFTNESTLGFNAVIGTHTNTAEADSTFNAVFVSSYNAGLPLPEGMTTDWFKSGVYSDLISCKEGGAAESYGLFDNDERLWSTSYAFVQSLVQLRYVVVVHSFEFNAGGLFTSTQTFEPATINGVLMIYDLKEKRICGAKKIMTEGPQNILYSYDAPSSNNGWKDKSDAAAAAKFEKENQDTLVGNTYRVLESQFKVHR